MILSLVVVALMLMNPQSVGGKFSKAANIAMILSVAIPAMLRQYGVQPEMVQIGALVLHLAQIMKSKGMMPAPMMMMM